MKRRTTVAAMPDDDESDDKGHVRHVFCIMDPTLMDATIASHHLTPTEELIVRETQALPPNQREPEFATLNSTEYHLIEVTRCSHLAMHLARANTNVSKWFYCATMSLGEKVPLDALANHFGIPRATVNRWTRRYKAFQIGDVEAWKTRARKTIAEYMERNGVHEGNALLLKDALLAFRANLVTLARNSLTKGSDPALSVGRFILHRQEPGDDKVWKRAVKGLGRTPAKTVRTCFEHMLTWNE